MHGAGGNNPMVQGNISAGTGGNINLGFQFNIAGNINLAEEYQVSTSIAATGDIIFGPQVNVAGDINLRAEEYQVGMDTTKSVLETGKSVLETWTSILVAGKLLYDIFGEKIGDIRNPEKKMEQLYKNARYLFARKDDVEEIIRESPNVATRESRLWLEDVKKLEVEVQSIKDEHMRCFNVFLRLTLGKRVRDVIEKITDLNNKRPKLKGKEFRLMHCLRVETQTVEMHDIIRDVALKEASGFLVKTGKHVKHPPEEKEWLQAQKISLMGCSLVRFLERPNWSILSTLLLQYNDHLTVISDSFFECMHSLCILNLSWTKIKSLPSSLGTLVNLRGLYLNDCDELEELPSQVGALKLLEVLHLRCSTAIRYLPREVGELTHLKCLIVG